MRVRTLFFDNDLMNPITTTSTSATGTTLSIPGKGVYTDGPKLQEKALYSTEAQGTTSVKMEMNTFDAIIGAAILAIIGMIIYLVATSQRATTEKKKSTKK